MKRIIEIEQKSMNAFIVMLDNIRRRNKNIADEIRATLKLLKEPINYGGGR